MNNFILDTNVILHDPLSYLRFGANHVIIPAIVFEEVDRKKELESKVGEAAREFVRQLLTLRKDSGKTLGEEIPLDNKGTLTVELSGEFEDTGDFTDKSRNDNRILAVAKNVHQRRSEFGEETTLITNDGLMIFKADALKIKAELYEYDRLVKDTDQIHTGVHRIYVDSNSIVDFYQKEGVMLKDIEERFEKNYYPGDFVILRNEMNTSNTALGKIQKVSNEMKVTPFVRKDINFRHVIPRNAEQQMMSEALLDSNVELLCVLGEAGSGKTLLSLAAGVSMMDDNSYTYQKMMVARPIVSMGKDLGALPGELEDKLRPWLMPIYDNLEYYFKAENQHELESLISEKGFLDIQALSYIRGRSLPNQLIIIDEAQNLSSHEVKTILSRAGEGSKVILLGDIKQIDNPYVDSTNNGLTYAVERMKGQEEVAIIKLEKTERSNLADLAVKLL